MPAYDSGLFDPPAPVALAVVRNPGTGETSDDIPAILDTGADVTLIPRTAVVSFVQSAELELILLGKSVRGRYLLYDRDYGIVGRDVLNLVSLHLDGPRLRWHGRFEPGEI